MGQKEKTFRVRVGEYRILYVAFLDKNSILVLNIDKRRFMNAKNSKHHLTMKL
jgi:hypothetical protein